MLIRFRGAYAYVDALPLRRERRADRAEIPVRLCRLGYLGDTNRWQYAFFTYSDMKYARQVAELIKSQHHEKLMNVDEFITRE